MVLPKSGSVGGWSAAKEREEKKGKLGNETGMKFVFSLIGSRDGRATGDAHMCVEVLR